MLVCKRSTVLATSSSVIREEMQRIQPGHVHCRRHRQRQPPLMVVTPSTSTTPGRLKQAPQKRSPIEVGLARGVLPFCGGIDRRLLRNSFEALSI